MAIDPDQTDDRASLESELDSLQSPQETPWSTLNLDTASEPSSSGPASSPTFDAAVKSGVIDDTLWSSKINQATKDLDAGTLPQQGVLGGFGLSSSPEEKAGILATREARLKAQEGTDPSTMDRLGTYGRQFLQGWAEMFSLDYWAGVPQQSEQDMAAAQSDGRAKLERTSFEARLRWAYVPFLQSQLALSYARSRAQFTFGVVTRRDRGE